MNQENQPAKMSSGLKREAPRFIHMYKFQMCMRSLVSAIFYSSLKKDENKQGKKIDRSTWMSHYESVTNMATTVQ